MMQYQPLPIDKAICEMEALVQQKDEHVLLAMRPEAIENLLVEIYEKALLLRTPFLPHNARTLFEGCATILRRIAEFHKVTGKEPTKQADEHYRRCKEVLLTYVKLTHRVDGADYQEAVLIDESIRVIQAARQLNRPGKAWTRYQDLTEEQVQKSMQYAQANLTQVIEAISTIAEETVRTGFPLSPFNQPGLKMDGLNLYRRIMALPPSLGLDSPVAQTEG